MTDLNEPLMTARQTQLEPEAEHDLEAGLPVVDPPEEPVEGAPTQVPTKISKYTSQFFGILCFGIDVDWLIWKHRVMRMTARPGYERMLLDRRFLRFVVLPGVIASVLIAEGYSKDWSFLTMVWENTLFLCLAGVAMCAPAVSHAYRFLEDLGIQTKWQLHKLPLLPDFCLALAAAEHTRRGMYNLLEEAKWGKEGSVSYAERGILCSEHLVMFWVVVLPLIAGRRLYVVGMYGGVLALMYHFTGLPGLGTFCAGAILLVPVVIVEITTSGVYDELHRCSMGIQALSEGAGGGLCSVDSAGRIVDASPELQAWWGDHYTPDMPFLELFDSQDDKDELMLALEVDSTPFRWQDTVDEDDPACRQENGYITRAYSNQTLAWERKLRMSHIGVAFKVTSMKCAKNATGMAPGKIVPVTKIPGTFGRQLTQIWVEIREPPAPRTCCGGTGKRPHRA